MQYDMSSLLVSVEGKKVLDAEDEGQAQEQDQGQDQGQGQGQLHKALVDEEGDQAIPRPDLYGEGNEGGEAIHVQVQDQDAVQHDSITGAQPVAREGELLESNPSPSSSQSSSQSQSQSQSHEEPKVVTVGGDSTGMKRKAEAISSTRWENGKVNTQEENQQDEKKQRCLLQRASEDTTSPSSQGEKEEEEEEQQQTPFSPVVPVKHPNVVEHTQRNGSSKTNVARNGEVSPPQEPAAKQLRPTKAIEGTWWWCKRAAGSQHKLKMQQQQQQQTLNVDANPDEEFEGTVAEIILVKRMGDEPGNDRYYVHWINCDRRLDEWVHESQLIREVEVAEATQFVPVSVATQLKRQKSFSKPDEEHGTPRTPMQSVGNAGAVGTTGIGGSNSNSNSNTTTNNNNSNHTHVHKSGGAHEPGRSLHHHGAGHDEHSKVRNISCVQFGRYEIGCWYFSPYPEPFGSMEKLWVCPFTFKYFGSKEAWMLHNAKLSDSRKRPPGREIYREDSQSRKVSVVEIDGSNERLYCQNLSLFSKLFIEHKTMYYDPAPFIFYIMCERDENETYTPVGYFSKERESADDYNLACILTLPPYQRKGYGKFIISLSFEITKREGKLGSPEKPLSDLGKLSYRSFWACKLLLLLDGWGELEDGTLARTAETPPRLTISDMAEKTGFKTEDILSTLQYLKMIKYYRGCNVIQVERTRVREMLQKYFDRHYTDYFCNPTLLKM